MRWGDEGDKRAYGEHSAEKNRGRHTRSRLIRIEKILYSFAPSYETLASLPSPDPHDRLSD